MFRRRAVSSTGVVAALATLGLSGVGQAGAQTPQDDTLRLLRESIISSTTAYVPLPTEYICPKGANLITASPDGKDVVILRTVNPPVRTLSALSQKPEEAGLELLRGEAPAMQMLLLSSGDDHVQVVWRGGKTASGLTMPDVPRWLPGSRLALVQTTTIPARLLEIMSRAVQEQGQDAGIDPATLPTMTQGLMLLNTATGKTQTLFDSLEYNANVIVSTTDSVAAIVQTDEKTGHGTVRRIGADGKLGGAVSFTKPGDKARFLYWTGFLPDNKTLTGILYENRSEEQTESGEQTEPGEPQSDTRAVYELDTLTGVITKSTSNTVVPGAFPPATANAELPYTVIREKQTVTRNGVATTIRPLWMESRDKTFTGRTLIAADSDVDAEPIVLQSAVLYQYKGSVYSVPILKSSAPEFLAQRREVQKRETLNRAQQISGGLMMYAQDNNECLPPVGSNLSSALTSYLKDDTVFQNPATGKSGFTALYKSVGLAAYKTPAEMPLGTLRGPGGVAVIFADGQVKWKDESVK